MPLTIASEYLNTMFSSSLPAPKFSFKLQFWRFLFTFIYLACVYVYMYVHVCAQVSCVEVRGQTTFGSVLSFYHQVPLGCQQSVLLPTEPPCQPKLLLWCSLPPLLIFQSETMLCGFLGCVCVANFFILRFSFQHFLAVSVDCAQIWFYCGMFYFLCLL